jgi:hypothetical protein
MSEELPRGLADPLHILEPFPGWARAAIVAALLLALLWMLWRRWARRRRVPVAARSPRRVAPRLDSIAEVIRRIRRRYPDAGSYRQGCHELSAVLRSFLERGSPHPFSILTAREIARALGEGEQTRLFDRLAELQFARRAPSRRDFRAICDLALEVVAAPRKRGEQ